MFKLGRPPAPSRPPTPVPQFKYLKNPKEHGRGFAHRQDPFEGDFCVVSIDHVASVAYLGPEAMEAAKRIPSGRYIAYVGSAYGIPYEGKTTNTFTLSLVCQGVPPTSAYCDETPACIPILPNDDSFGGRQPLEACAPFPWPNCYISTFATRDCRVTTAKRDYSPVLCLTSLRMAAKMQCTISSDSFYLGDFYDRRHAGDAEALERMPFSPSPEPSSDPLPFLPPMQESTGISGPSAHNSNPTTEPSSTSSPKSHSDLSSNIPLNAALATAMFSSGNTRDPVVNIWYDLGMVSEVRDPELFLKECDMLDLLRLHFQALRKGADKDRHRTTTATKARSSSPRVEPSVSSVLFGSTAAQAATMSHTEHSPPVEGHPLSIESHLSDSSVPVVAMPTSAVAATAAADNLSPPHSPTGDVSRSPVLSTPTRITASVPQSTQQLPPMPFSASPRLAAAHVVDADGGLPSGKHVRHVRSSSLRAARRSTSRASLRSRKGSAAASALPTKNDFPLHPHPYADRPTRSTSTLSYAVPRSGHDTLKSLRKSRSSASLKAPRRAETFPVPSSRSARH
ncbi:unnamed protein product [Peniophora sp. CBMAI 1063]|nr:unnamed protein product [Peniophora sp. CBMAI 1063]